MSCDAVGNDACLYIVSVWQPEVLLGGDVTEQRSAWATINKYRPHSRCVSSFAVEATPLCQKFCASNLAE